MTDATRRKAGLSEHDLLIRIAEGDTRAFEEFLFRHESAVYHFVLKLTQNKELAEEITQDVFLKMWETLSRGIAINHVSAWLFSASKNLGLNKLKEAAARRQRETVYAMSAANDEDPFFQFNLREMEHLIDRAINEMPDRLGRIFRMKAQEGLTNEQIARRLDISPHTVKNNLTKSYSILKELIREHAISLAIAILLHSDAVA